MKKYLKNLFYPTIFLGIFLFLFSFSNSAFATGAVSFTEDTIVSLSGISDGSLLIASSSQATSVDVTGAVLNVSAIPNGDSFILKTPTSTNALKLTPSGGTLDLIFNSANLSVGYITEWTVTSISTTTVAHIVGVPLANTWYNIKIGGTILNSYQSSAGGEVSFTYSGGWSTKVFTIERDLTAPTSFSLTAPVNYAYISVDQTAFSWNASTDSESGIAKYQLYMDGYLMADNISGTSVTLADNLSCVNHTWYVKAIDNAGNSTNSSTFNLATRCGGGGAPFIILQPQTSLPNSTTTTLNNNTTSSKIIYNEVVLTGATTTAPIPLITYNSSTTLPSAKFTRGLERGMKNSDVKRLQQLLATNKEIYPEGLVTGYFGPATEKAVGRFQLKYKLISSKKDRSYGYVGPKTRAKLLEVFGK